MSEGTSSSTTGRRSLCDACQGEREERRLAYPRFVRGLSAGGLRRPRVAGLLPVRSGVLPRARFGRGSGLAALIGRPSRPPTPTSPGLPDRPLWPRPPQRVWRSAFDREATSPRWRSSSSTSSKSTGVETQNSRATIKHCRPGSSASGIDPGVSSSSGSGITSGLASGSNGYASNSLRPPGRLRRDGSTAAGGVNHTSSRVA